MPSRPVFLVTNPLHYLYYLQDNRSEVKCVGSSRGPVADVLDDFTALKSSSLYDVASSPEALVGADADPDASYISWRPFRSSIGRLLGAKIDVTRTIENKANIRQILQRDVFPRFLVLSVAEIKDRGYGQLLRQLATKKLVLQVPDSTGGKGTYFIADVETFRRTISQLPSDAGQMVVSAHVDGVARGLQCLVLNGKVFSTPWWHVDLVDVEGVCVSDSPNATRYCGAVVDNVPEHSVAEVKEIISKVGKSIYNSGFEGVFGIDIVVDNDSKRIFVIEVNARFTAVSALYASIMRSMGSDCDYMTAYLRHSLGEPVQYETTKLCRFNAQLKSEYYYLKLQNTALWPVQLNAKCRLGVYSQKVAFCHSGWGVESLDNDSQLLVIPEAKRGVVRQPGERVFSVVGRGNPIKRGGLSSECSELVSSFRNTLTTGFRNNEQNAKN